MKNSRSFLTGELRSGFKRHVVSSLTASGSHEYSLIRHGMGSLSVPLVFDLLAFTFIHVENRLMKSGFDDVNPLALQKKQQQKR